MRRTLASAVAALFLVATPASALSFAEIIELSRSGVSDEVLVALIEVDGTTWHLTPEQVVELTEAGVGERVVLALVDSGREALQGTVEEPLVAEEPMYEIPQVTIVPVPPELPPEGVIYADAPGNAVFVEHYETVVPVPIFVDLPDERRKGHHHQRPSHADESFERPLPRRGGDDPSSSRGGGPDRREEAPKERWARDLPNPAIPASDQPRYRDHSRDLGARDLRALLRQQSEKTEKTEKSEKTEKTEKSEKTESDRSSSSDSESSRSDSSSDRRSRSSRRQ